MNEISFSKFEKKELDLFFSICQKLKEKGTKSIQLDFSELKELSSYTNKDLDVFINDLKSTYDKMLKLDFTIGNDPHNFTKFNLFNEYTVSAQTKTVTIATNEKFSYILNEINPYTKFELLEFVSLKSKYSKNIFKKLKQYTRTYESDYKTLFWEVSIEEFRRLLDISDVYKKMSQLDKWVFKPILEELPPYFKNLKIQKIKQGKSISKLKFTWLKQHESNDEVINITITQDLQDAFDKTIKNRFIKEFLTEENKHKLIASFDEKDLIRGLKYAKDNINYSFKTFSYLENSIKKGLEKPIVKTTIVKINIPEEKNIILGEQLSIKTKVTRKEYEECYQEYLKNNNKKNGKEIRASWEFSVKTKFEIIEENKDVENDKDQFPPNDFSKFEKENTKIEYPPLEECSTQTQELAAKLKKKREEFEKLNNFSKEILLSIIKLKTEISSAGFFSKKMLENELVNFEQKSQEWHWLFAGLEYKTLSLDNLKYFNELTKYFEDKLGIVISETVIEQCVNHIQESPINIEGNNLSSDTLKNLILIKDIPEDKLLSKNGKRLVGGALISRLKKISRELEKDIQLENGNLIFG